MQEATLLSVKQARTRSDPSPVYRQLLLLLMYSRVLGHIYAQEVYTVSIIEIIFNDF